MLILTKMSGQLRVRVSYTTVDCLNFVRTGQSNIHASHTCILQQKVVLRLKLTKIPLYQTQKSLQMCKLIDLKLMKTNNRTLKLKHNTKTMFLQCQ